MTSFAHLRAFVNAAGLPFAMLADRQEYLPRSWRFAGNASGTDAAVVASSADCARKEMIFEHLAPSCYLCGPSLVLLEQGASASQALDEQALDEQALDEQALDEQDLDELPAEDMHRAIWDISEVYAEICETVERIVACTPRDLDHGKKANGMSAGG